MDIDLDDLQGNVLCAYPFPQSAYLFCGVHDPAAARRWLGDLAGVVRSAAPWGASPPEETVNVALSCAGLRAIGVPDEDLARLPPEFRAGMAARAGRLKDVEEDAPEHWEAGLDDRDAHVLLSLHVRSPDPAALEAAVTRWAPPAGVTVLATQRNRRLSQGREHFGFSDGLAQPAIDASAGPYHGHGTPERRRQPVERWPPLATGELVLGYRDEDGDTPAGPAPLDRNASFMVVRKLDQHVGAWRRQLLRWADGDPELAARLAARVVGRWQNGTPVVTSPDGPDPALDADVDALTPAARLQRFRLLNDFRFGGDGTGVRCPVGAHVRRANPRDAFGDGRLARRHRIVRRGMPYGDPYDPAEEAHGGEEAQRGLFFVCFQASIARQFELIQGDWLQDGDAFGLGAQRDPLMGPATDQGRMLVHDGGPRMLTRHDRVVRLRGGGYFVVPSLTALRSWGMSLNTQLGGSTI